MENKIFRRLTKTIAILLVICFALSVTVTSVNAEALEDKHGQGYKDGYSRGSNDGKKDCNQYGSKDILQKMPNPSSNDKSYIKSFILGYMTGYSEKRYSCLQKTLMLKK